MAFPLIEPGKLETLKNTGAKRESRAKEEIKPTLALDVPGIAEVLNDKGKLVYLTNGGDIVEKVVIENIVYSPPPKESVPYLLAEKDRVLKYLPTAGTAESDSKLYEDLLQYHKDISDLPDTIYYDLLVLWDIHTYLLDKVHFSPMLYLYAVKERGKSRTAKGSIFVSRRGVFTETIREADIIRWGNDHRAALGFDAKDFPKKIQRANCDDLILARFEKGSVSSRTLWPEKGAFQDTKVFNIFGPTIIATNRPVDDILESRCISIDMKPSFRKFNNPVLPENGLDLKARLVAFKFQHQNTELVQTEKPVLGRLGDILGPLNDIVLTFFPNKAERFSLLVEKVVQKKQEEATDTFEAQVVEALIKAKAMVTKSFVSIDEVTGLFNAGRDERFSVDVRTIGKILRGLGFSPRKNPEGDKRGVFYDPELIKKISYQYGLLDISETMSETSEMAENTSETDVSDISDIKQDIPKGEKKNYEEVDIKEVLEE